MSISQRNYHINTLYKTSGTNENFKYQLQIPASEGYDRVVLLNASIPNSFYLIQSGYNTFTLREGGVDTTITIPPGNYSAKVFAQVVSALMTQTNPNGWTYTMTLPNQNVEASTGKFTYSVAGNFGSQPSIICTDNVNEQLGFAANSTNTFANDKIISTTVVNFAPESTIFIHSDIADNGDSDVLQEIYSGNTPTLAVITYQCSAPEYYSKALQSRQSNTFNFSITNEKKQLMNLNGVDVQLTLCLYKKDDTNDLVRKYIKYKVHTEAQPETPAAAEI
jgi:hypothetical protein